LKVVIMQNMLHYLWYKYRRWHCMSEWSWGKNTSKQTNKKPQQQQQQLLLLWWPWHRPYCD